MYLEENKKTKGKTEHHRNLENTHRMNKITGPRHYHSPKTQRKIYLWAATYILQRDNCYHQSVISLLECLKTITPQILCKNWCLSWAGPLLLDNKWLSLKINFRLLCRKLNWSKLLTGQKQSCAQARRKWSKPWTEFHGTISCWLWL